MIIVVALVQKKQAIATKAALILSIFLVMSVGYVYISSGTSIRSFGDAAHFIGVYFSWLGSVFDNFRTLTANVINLNWGANHS